MRVVLSTTEYDALAPVVLDVKVDNTDWGTIRRRVTRSATIDGSAVFVDFGQSDADTTIVLKWVPVSRDDEEYVTRLVKLYPLITVATIDGLFLACPESYTTTASESTLSLLVKSRLSA